MPNRLLEKSWKLCNTTNACMTVDIVAKTNSLQGRLAHQAIHQLVRRYQLDLKNFVRRIKVKAKCNLTGKTRCEFNKKNKMRVYLDRHYEHMKPLWRALLWVFFRVIVRPFIDDQNISRIIRVKISNAPIAVLICFNPASRSRPSKI